MATFKLCIAEPKTGKTYQKEVKDDAASQFMGLNIGESVKGDDFGLSGYELSITGGSDYCGFPMRRGILGQRKKITVLGGVGFKSSRKGMKKSKTVCGHKIHDRISQINLKITKTGSKNISEIFGTKEKDDKKVEKKAEEKKLSSVKEKLPKEGLQDSKNLEKGLDKSKTSQKDEPKAKAEKKKVAQDKPKESKPDKPKDKESKAEKK